VKDSGFVEVVAMYADLPKQFEEPAVPCLQRKGYPILSYPACPVFIPISQ